MSGLPKVVRYHRCKRALSIPASDGKPTKHIEGHYVYNDVIWCVDCFGTRMSTRDKEREISLSLFRV